MSSDFEQARTLFLTGLEHFEADRLAEAEHSFEASLALLPGRASTLTNLGAVRLRRQQPQAALICLEQAVAAEPDNLEAWAHHAIALGMLDRPQEALASDDRALAIDPACGAVHRHRGLVLQSLQRHGEAATAFERYVALHSDDPRGWNLLGEALLQLGRPEDALAAFDRSLALDDTQADAWSRRGSLLKQLGQPADAAKAFERALQAGADPEVNGFLLASVSGRAAPDAPPPGYVQSLFDGYADDFEHHLVEVLRYQGHTRLVEALPAIAGRPFASALDLGCGTGLCAPLLQPLAARLTGVDLAQRMVQQARRKGHYHVVLQADLIDHLATTPERHDLVVAADVLNYVGALDPVFRGVRRVLEPGGLFCFTVERAEGEGFVLQPSLTYGHTEAYLRALAAEHQLEVLQIASHPVREDQRQPVQGWYVYLRATA